MIDRSIFTQGRGNPDVPVPIAEGVTVPTEPMALLLADALKIGPESRVLEIGTGSGYQTAILAERCKEVVSIDIQQLPGVAERLPANVTLIEADGLKHDTGEQFDAVLVTFAVEEIPAVWVKQLREWALLVVPLRRQLGCAISVFRKQLECPLFLKFRDTVAYAPFVEARSA
jgi:protein-L-isoaspartate(D-aspartate) O-methyltransferase